MRIAERYARNCATVTEEEQLRLGGFCAAVVGLGGLGGHIAEQLARLGFGRLILLDDEKVEESNLNRQLFATTLTLGALKVDAAAERLRAVNPECALRCLPLRLTDRNASDLLAEADIVMDAVDSVPARLLLEKCCRELEKPLVHGAIGGWYGQVSFIMPGDDTLSRLYPAGSSPEGLEQKLGNPAFIPWLVASLQTAEALKYCLGRGALLKNKLLSLDLLNHKYSVVSLP